MSEGLSTQDPFYIHLLTQLVGKLANNGPKF